MYIHEICEWLAEAKLQERSNYSNASCDFEEARLEDESGDANCAILNGVTMMQQRPSNSST